MPILVFPPPGSPGSQALTATFVVVVPEAGTPKQVLQSISTSTVTVFIQEGIPVTSQPAYYSADVVNWYINDNTLLPLTPVSQSTITLTYRSTPIYNPLNKIKIRSSSYEFPIIVTPTTVTSTSLSFTNPIELNLPVISDARIYFGENTTVETPRYSGDSVPTYELKYTGRKFPKIPVLEIPERGYQLTTVTNTTATLGPTVGVPIVNQTYFDSSNYVNYYLYDSDIFTVTHSVPPTITVNFVYDQRIKITNLIRVANQEYTYPRVLTLTSSTNSSITFNNPGDFGVWSQGYIYFQEINSIQIASYTATNNTVLLGNFDLVARRKVRIGVELAELPNLPNAEVVQKNDQLRAIGYQFGKPGPSFQNITTSSIVIFPNPGYSALTQSAYYSSDIVRNYIYDEDLFPLTASTESTVVLTFNPVEYINLVNKVRISGSSYTYPTILNLTSATNTSVSFVNPGDFPIISEPVIYFGQDSITENVRYSSDLVSEFSSALVSNPVFRIVQPLFELRPRAAILVTVTNYTSTMFSSIGIPILNQTAYYTSNVVDYYINDNDLLPLTAISTASITISFFNSIYTNQLNRVRIANETYEYPRVINLTTSNSTSITFNNPGDFGIISEGKIYFQESVTQVNSVYSESPYQFNIAYPTLDVKRHVRIGEQFVDTTLRVGSQELSTVTSSATIVYPGPAIPIPYLESKYLADVVNYYINDNDLLPLTNLTTASIRLNFAYTTFQNPINKIRIFGPEYNYPRLITITSATNTYVEFANPGDLPVISDPKFQFAENSQIDTAIYISRDFANFTYLPYRKVKLGNEIKASSTSTITSGAVARYKFSLPLTTQFSNQLPPNIGAINVWTALDHDLPFFNTPLVYNIAQTIYTTGFPAPGFYTYTSVQRGDVARGLAPITIPGDIASYTNNYLVFLGRAPLREPAAGLVKIGQGALTRRIVEPIRFTRPNIYITVTSATSFARSVNLQDIPAKYTSDYVSYYLYDNDIFTITNLSTVTSYVLPFIDSNVNLDLYTPDSTIQLANRDSGYIYPSPITFTSYDTTSVSITLASELPIISGPRLLFIQPSSVDILLTQSTASFITAQGSVGSLYTQSLVSSILPPVSPRERLFYSRLAPGYGLRGIPIAESTRSQIYPIATVTTPRVGEHVVIGDPFASVEPTLGLGNFTLKPRRSLVVGDGIAIAGNIFQPNRIEYSRFPGVSPGVDFGVYIRTLSTVTSSAAIVYPGPIIRVPYLDSNYTSDVVNWYINEETLLPLTAVSTSTIRLTFQNTSYVNPLNKIRVFNSNYTYPNSITPGLINLTSATNNYIEFANPGNFPVISEPRFQFAEISSVDVALFSTSATIVRPIASILTSTLVTATVFMSSLGAVDLITRRVKTNNFISTDITISSGATTLDYRRKNLLGSNIADVLSTATQLTAGTLTTRRSLRIGAILQDTQISTPVIAKFDFIVARARRIYSQWEGFYSSATQTITQITTTATIRYPNVGIPIISQQAKYSSDAVSWYIYDNNTLPINQITTSSITYFFDPFAYINPDNVFKAVNERTGVTHAPLYVTTSTAGSVTFANTSIPVVSDLKIYFGSSSTQDIVTYSSPIFLPRTESYADQFTAVNRASVPSALRNYYMHKIAPGYNSVQAVSFTHLTVGGRPPSQLDNYIGTDVITNESVNLGALPSNRYDVVNQYIYDTNVPQRTTGYDSNITLNFDNNNVPGVTPLRFKLGQTVRFTQSESTYTGTATITISNLQGVTFSTPSGFPVLGGIVVTNITTASYSVDWAFRDLSDKVTFRNNTRVLENLAQVGRKPNLRGISIFLERGITHQHTLHKTTSDGLDFYRDSRLEGDYPVQTTGRSAAEPILIPTPDLRNPYNIINSYIFDDNIITNNARADRIQYNAVQNYIYDNEIFTRSVISAFTGTNLVTYDFDRRDFNTFPAGSMIRLKYGLNQITTATVVSSTVYGVTIQDIKQFPGANNLTISRYPATLANQFTDNFTIDNKGYAIYNYLLARMAPGIRKGYTSNIFYASETSRLGPLPKLSSSIVVKPDSWYASRTVTSVQTSSTIVYPNGRIEITGRSQEYTNNTVNQYIFDRDIFVGSYILFNSTYLLDSNQYATPNADRIQYNSVNIYTYDLELYSRTNIFLDRSVITLYFNKNTIVINPNNIVRVSNQITGYSNTFTIFNVTSRSVDLLNPNPYSTFPSISNLFLEFGVVTTSDSASFSNYNRIPILTQSNLPVRSPSVRRIETSATTMVMSLPTYRDRLTTAAKVIAPTQISTQVAKSSIKISIGSTVVSQNFNRTLTGITTSTSIVYHSSRVAQVTAIGNKFTNNIVSLYTFERDIIVTQTIISPTIDVYYQNIVPTLNYDKVKIERADTGYSFESNIISFHAGVSGLPPYIKLPVSIGFPEVSATPIFLSFGIAIQNNTPIYTDSNQIGYVPLQRYIRQKNQILTPVVQAIDVPMDLRKTWTGSTASSVISYSGNYGLLPAPASYTSDYVSTYINDSDIFVITPLASTSTVVLNFQTHLDIVTNLNENNVIRLSNGTNEWQAILTPTNVSTTAITFTYVNFPVISEPQVSFQRTSSIATATYTMSRSGIYVESLSKQTVQVKAVERRPEYAVTRQGIKLIGEISYPVRTLSTVTSTATISYPGPGIEIIARNNFDVYNIVSEYTFDSNIIRSTSVLDTVQYNTVNLYTFDRDIWIRSVIRENITLFYTLNGPNPSNIIKLYKTNTGYEATPTVLAFTNYEDGKKSVTIAYEPNFPSISNMFIQFGFNSISSTPIYLDNNRIPLVTGPRFLTKNYRILSFVPEVKEVYNQKQTLTTVTTTATQVFPNYGIHTSHIPATYTSDYVTYYTYDNDLFPLTTISQPGNITLFFTPTDYINNTNQIRLGNKEYTYPSVINLTSATNTSVSFNIVGSFPIISDPTIFFAENSYIDTAIYTVSSRPITYDIIKPQGIKLQDPSRPIITKSTLTTFVTPVTQRSSIPITGIIQSRNNFIPSIYVRDNEILSFTTSTANISDFVSVYTFDRDIITVSSFNAITLQFTYPGFRQITDKIAVTNVNSGYRTIHTVLTSSERTVTFASTSNFPSVSELYIDFNWISSTATISYNDSISSIALYQPSLMSEGQVRPNVINGANVREAYFKSLLQPSRAGRRSFVYTTEITPITYNPRIESLRTVNQLRADNSYATRQLTGLSTSTNITYPNASVPVTARSGLFNYNIVRDYIFDNNILPRESRTISAITLFFDKNTQLVTNLVKIQSPSLGYSFEITALSTSQNSITIPAIPLPDILDLVVYFGVSVSTNTPIYLDYNRVPNVGNPRALTNKNQILSPVVSNIADISNQFKNLNTVTTTSTLVFPNIGIPITNQAAQYTSDVVSYYIYDNDLLPITQLASTSTVTLFFNTTTYINTDNKIKIVNPNWESSVYNLTSATSSYITFEAANFGIVSEGRILFAQTSTIDTAVYSEIKIATPVAKLWTGIVVKDPSTPRITVRQTSQTVFTPIRISGAIPVTGIRSRSNNFVNTYIYDTEFLTFTTSNNITITFDAVSAAQVGNSVIIHNGLGYVSSFSLTSATTRLATFVNPGNFPEITGMYFYYYTTQSSAVTIGNYDIVNNITTTTSQLSYSNQSPFFYHRLGVKGIPFQRNQLATQNTPVANYVKQGLKVVADSSYPARSLISVTTSSDIVYIGNPIYITARSTEYTNNVVSQYIFETDRFIGNRIVTATITLSFYPTVYINPLNKIRLVNPNNGYSQDINISSSTNRTITFTPPLGDFPAISDLYFLFGQTSISSTPIYTDNNKVTLIAAMAAVRPKSVRALMTLPEVVDIDRVFQTLTTVTSTSSLVFPGSGTPILNQYPTNTTTAVTWYYNDEDILYVTQNTSSTIRLAFESSTYINPVNKIKIAHDGYEYQSIISLTSATDTYIEFADPGNFPVVINSRIYFAQSTTQDIAVYGQGRSPVRIEKYRDISILKEIRSTITFRTTSTVYQTPTGAVYPLALTGQTDLVNDNVVNWYIYDYDTITFTPITTSTITYSFATGTNLIPLIKNSTIYIFNENTKIGQTAAIVGFTTSTLTVTRPGLLPEISGTTIYLNFTSTTAVSTYSDDVQKIAGIETSDSYKTIFEPRNQKEALYWSLLAPGKYGQTFPAQGKSLTELIDRNKTAAFFNKLVYRPIEVKITDINNSLSSPITVTSTALTFLNPGYEIVAQLPTSQSMDIVNWYINENTLLPITAITTTSYQLNFYGNVYQNPLNKVRIVKGNYTSAVLTVTNSIPNQITVNAPLGLPPVSGGFIYFADNISIDTASYTDVKRVPVTGNLLTQSSIVTNLAPITPQQHLFWSLLSPSSYGRSEIIIGKQTAPIVGARDINPTVQSAVYGTSTVIYITNPVSVNGRSNEFTNNVVNDYIYDNDISIFVPITTSTVTLFYDNDQAITSNYIRLVKNFTGYTQDFNAITVTNSQTTFVTTSSLPAISEMQIYFGYPTITDVITYNDTGRVENIAAISSIPKLQLITLGIKGYNGITLNPLDKVLRESDPFYKIKTLTSVSSTSTIVYPNQGYEPIAVTDSISDNFVTVYTYDQEVLLQTYTTSSFITYDFYATGYYINPNNTVRIVNSNNGFDRIYSIVSATNYSITVSNTGDLPDVSGTRLFFGINTTIDTDNYSYSVQNFDNLIGNLTQASQRLGEAVSGIKLSSFSLQNYDNPGFILDPYYGIVSDSTYQNNSLEYITYDKDVFVTGILSRGVTTTLYINNPYNKIYDPKLLFYPTNYAKLTLGTFTSVVYLLATDYYTVTFNTVAGMPVEVNGMTIVNVSYAYYPQSEANKIVLTNGILFQPTTPKQALASSLYNPLRGIDYNIDRVLHQPTTILKYDPKLSTFYSSRIPGDFSHVLLDQTSNTREIYDIPTWYEYDRDLLTYSTGSVSTKKLSFNTIVGVPFPAGRSIRIRNDSINLNYITTVTEAAVGYVIINQPTVTFPTAGTFVELVESVLYPQSMVVTTVSPQSAKENLYYFDRSPGLRATKGPPVASLQTLLDSGSGIRKDSTIIKGDVLRFDVGKILQPIKIIAVDNRVSVASTKIKLTARSVQDDRRIVGKLRSAITVRADSSTIVYGKLAERRIVPNLVSVRDNLSVSKLTNYENIGEVTGPYITITSHTDLGRTVTGYSQEWADNFTTVYAFDQDIITQTYVRTDTVQIFYNAGNDITPLFPTGSEFYLQDLNTGYQRQFIALEGNIGNVVINNPGFLPGISNMQIVSTASSYPITLTFGQQVLQPYYVGSYISVINSIGQSVKVVLTAATRSSVTYVKNYSYRDFRFAPGSVSLASLSVPVYPSATVRPTSKPTNIRENLFFVSLAPNYEHRAELEFTYSNLVDDVSVLSYDSATGIINKYMVGDTAKGQTGVTDPSARRVEPIQFWS